MEQQQINFYRRKLGRNPALFHEYRERLIHELSTMIDPLEQIAYILANYISSKCDIDDIDEEVLQEYFINNLSGEQFTFLENLKRNDEFVRNNIDQAIKHINTRTYLEELIEIINEALRLGPL